MADVKVTPQPWLWRLRTKPIRFIEIHATRGSTTPEKQKSAALNWVQSPNNRYVTAWGEVWGGSFSYVIGTDGSMGTVLSDDRMPTYSAGYGGQGSTYAIDEYGISYELAQSAALEPFTEACYRRAAKEVAAKCKKYRIPAEFLTITNQTGTVPTGLVRHDRCQNGYVLGKTDPGAQFDEAKFLALVKAEMEDDMDRAQFNKWWNENWAGKVADVPDGVTEPTGHLNRYLRGGYPRLQKNVAVAATKGGVLTKLAAQVNTLEALKNSVGWGTDRRTMGEWFTEWRAAIKALQEAVAELKAGSGSSTYTDAQAVQAVKNALPDA